MSWEYEALFDVEPAKATGTLMDWVDEGQKRKATAIRIGSMGYRTRTTVAGPRLEAEVYPIFGRNTEATLRRA